MIWNSTVSYAEPSRLKLAREELRKANEKYEAALAAHSTAVEKAEGTARKGWLEAFIKELLVVAPQLKDVKAYQGIDIIESEVFFVFKDPDQERMYNTPKLTIRIYSTRQYINASWHYWSGEKYNGQREIDLKNMTPKTATEKIWQQIKSDTDL